jgi:hypothetical protein
MPETSVCDYCGDLIEGDAIQRGNKVYCCEACAFEGSRSVDCGGRADTTIAQSSVEQA